jgi:hypothetical protein
MTDGFTPVSSRTWSGIPLTVAAISIAWREKSNGTVTGAEAATAMVGDNSPKNPHSAARRMAFALLPIDTRVSAMSRQVLESMG